MTLSHSQLKCENVFSSKSNGKAFDFELLKGFELLIWINTRFESRIFPLHCIKLTSKGIHILFKNKKNYLILREITISSKHWHCPIQRRMKYFQLADSFCIILQSISTAWPLQKCNWKTLVLHPELHLFA